MKLVLYVFVLTFLVYESKALKNWTEHSLYPCIKCLCHARSGCWIRQNCARYSINFDYWKEAGSLVVDLDHPPNDKNSYNACMKNENCIVGTIIQYTEQFGERDCNCDGKFDCKDRAAIHLYGSLCSNPNFGAAFAGRFNECAKRIKVDDMLTQEGSPSCYIPGIQPRAGVF